jgi:hypothetical protein
MNNYIDTATALNSLFPNSQFSITNGVITWLSPDITQPTEAEIQAEIARLEAEQPWKELRQKRNRLLAETDWVSMKALDASTDGLGIQLPQVWMDYRQALRDLPANTTDPANPDWPVKPGGEA